MEGGRRGSDDKGWRYVQIYEDETAGPWENPGHDVMNMEFEEEV